MYRSATVFLAYMGHLTWCMMYKSKFPRISTEYNMLLYLSCPMHNKYFIVFFYWQDLMHNNCFLLANANVDPRIKILIKFLTLFLCRLKQKTNISGPQKNTQFLPQLSLWQILISERGKKKKMGPLVSDTKQVTICHIEKLWQNL